MVLESEESAADGVAEAPEWLLKLEERREQRLRSRLGHEIGAGSRCIQCADACPGLDLHFWRKICKNCKCSKESHDVKPDDDVYGWVQFQLLGNELVKRHTRKIQLTGRNAPLDLDWVPYGSDNNVKKYLNELHPDLIPVTGSKAARLRHQNLQKQIPAHDIDSSLCHELSQDELREFDKYVGHLKKASVGEGGVIKLQLTSKDPNRLSGKFSELALRPNVVNVQPSIKPLESTQEAVKVNITDKVYPVYDNVHLYVTKLPKCAQCNLEIDDEVIAVQIKRSNKLWHTQCFKCASCAQLLVDLMYFFNKLDGLIYCGRDYARIKGIPRCVACDELIFSKEYCWAENSVFHVKHFCCFHCDKPLAGSQYLMDNGQPICLHCFEKLKAKSCTACGLKISPDQEGVSVNGVHWHAVANCFKCFSCSRSLIGSKMLMKNFQAFCSKLCYEQKIANK